MDQCVWNEVELNWRYSWKVTYKTEVLRAVSVGVYLFFFVFFEWSVYYWIITVWHVFITKLIFSHFYPTFLSWILLWIPGFKKLKYYTLTLCSILNKIIQSFFLHSWKTAKQRQGNFPCLPSGVREQPPTEGVRCHRQCYNASSRRRRRRKKGFLEARGQDVLTSWLHWWAPNKTQVLRSGVRRGCKKTQTFAEGRRS